MDGSVVFQAWNLFEIVCASLTEILRSAYMLERMSPMRREAWTEALRADNSKLSSAERERSSEFESEANDSVAVRLSMLFGRPSMAERKQSIT